MPNKQPILKQNCPPLPKPLNGRWKGLNLTTFLLDCDFDYVMYGFSKISCFNGQWVSQGTGECIEKSIFPY